jgi:hypothetical protein
MECRVAACCLALIFASSRISFAECETNTFIEAVNAAWVSSNYTLLEQTLTNRVTECTNDILAKGLLYEYYDDIGVEFYKAKAAAVAFVSAVSNRAPSEVMHKRSPLGLPVLLAEMPPPTNFPSNQAKTYEQMQSMHNEFQEEFPFIGLFQGLILRMEAVESGKVTDEYFDPLNLNNQGEPE